MAEDKIKKQNEELQEEQLDEVSGGTLYPPKVRDPFE